METDAPEPLIGSPKSPRTWKYIFILAIIFGGTGLWIYMAMTPVSSLRMTDRFVGTTVFDATITPSIAMMSSPDDEIRDISGQWYAVNHKMYVNGYTFHVDIEGIVDSSGIAMTHGIGISADVVMTVYLQDETIFLRESPVCTLTTALSSANITRGQYNLRLSSAIIPFNFSRPFLMNEEVTVAFTVTVDMTMMDRFGQWIGFSTIHAITEPLRYVNFDEDDVETAVTAVSYTLPLMSGVALVGIVSKKRHPRTALRVHYA